jgi:hypothetical protein
VSPCRHCGAARYRACFESAQKTCGFPERRTCR